MPKMSSTFYCRVSSWQLHIKGSVCILSYQAVGRLWSSTSSSTEEMAAFPRLGTKTAPTVTLGSTVGLGELLAVSGSLSPTSGLTGLMTRGALSLRLLEVVDVDVSALGRVRDDLVPLDGLDVAEVVVVENAHAALQNI